MRWGPPPPSPRLGTGSAPGSRGGYVALLAILIIAALAASTVLILFITSLNSALNSRDVASGKIAKVMAESCAELALQRLSSWNPASTVDCDGGALGACPATTVGTQGRCDIVSISGTDGVGNTWTIRTKGYDNIVPANTAITKLFEVKANRTLPGAAATVSSWKECLNFDLSPCPTP